MLVHQRVTIINFRESPFAEKDIRFGPPTKTSGPSGSAPEPPGSRQSGGAVRGTLMFDGPKLP